MELWKQKQKPVSLAQGCLPQRVSGFGAEATARASATWSAREYLSAFTSDFLPSSPCTSLFLFLLLLPFSLRPLLRPLLRLDPSHPFLSLSTRVSSRPRGALHHAATTFILGP